MVWSWAIKKKELVIKLETYHPDNRTSFKLGVDSISLKCFRIQIQTRNDHQIRVGIQSQQRQLRDQFSSE